MTHLIVGYGEVGKAIHKVLGKADWLDLDKGNARDQGYDVLHISIPYSKHFQQNVKELKNRYNPKLVIVHSTVPIGTCKKLGAVHSPIRGVHPNLAKGIKTFVKFFGGAQAKEASLIFKKLGIKTHCTPNSNNTEAMKLWDTSQYGAMILLNKEIYNFCKQYQLDFNVVYTEANKTYNEGYTKLGRKEVVRPYLKYIPGKIGGHCVIQNSHLFNSHTSKKLRAN